MARRGHKVKVVSPKPRPAWFSVDAEFIQTHGLDPGEIPPADVTVATYWTTIRPAIAGASGEVVHYCQGFEASYTHNTADHPAILAAYAEKIPAFALSPHLGRLVRERFARPSRVVPLALEPHWFDGWSWRWRPRRRPRVLVTSPFEIDWKGVPTSLEAVRGLRRDGLELTLVRLSQWPLATAERELLVPDEFHEHVLPAHVPELMRGCDLLLAASWEQEGFGMPVLEAMACGVPVVASDIACFRDFASPAARLVRFDDPGWFSPRRRARSWARPGCGAR
ncbi:MAG: glycosyltransferase, partial [Thermoanaerobaculia bacterium]|nr:glycosyltransferase [Thermoanaerobaculia bacterium]